MILSEDGRDDDSEGSEELACTQNEHGTGEDAFEIFKKSPASFSKDEGRETVGRGRGRGVE
jgi:hypothetical protein